MRVDEEHEPLERLYARLATALQSRRSEPWSAPVTVAEIYQDLVPYRVVRDDAGFAMNADYEHALLRLLSGEGDWARLEPPTARDVIERELRSSNPNVTIYREYAGCDVWIKPPRAELQAAATAATPAQPDDDTLDELELLTEEIEEEMPKEELSRADATRSTFALDEADAAPPLRPTSSAAAQQPAPAPAGGQTAAADGQAAAPGQAADPGGQAAAAAATAAAGAAGAEAQGSRCAFCESRLPSRRKVRFCPFCGGDQSMVPCGTCGEALEVAWLFCVACGTSAPIS